MEPEHRTHTVDPQDGNHNSIPKPPNYDIVIDCALDFTPGLLALASAEQIHFSSMMMSLGDEEVEISVHSTEEQFCKLYERMSEGFVPATSATTIFAYEKTFEEIAKQGRDVLCLCLSGQLSSTFGNAVMAGRNLQEKYPQRKFAVVDSKSATAKMTRVVEAAIDHWKEGLSLEENEKRTSAITSLPGFAVIQDLDYLKRSGRLTATGAFFAKALQVRPMIEILSNGSLTVLVKTRGMKQAYQVLVDKALELRGHRKPLVGHCNNLEGALELKERILTQTPYTEVEISTVNPIIGTHLGPGAVIMVL
ncbi:MAG: DegV family protein [Tissierellia bacterium]|nr:DegV family protein [Tissierellia bacterium]